MMQITLWLGAATWLLTVGMWEGTRAPTRLERGVGAGAFVIGGLMWLTPLYAYATTG